MCRCRRSVLVVVVVRVVVVVVVVVRVVVVVVVVADLLFVFCVFFCVKRVSVTFIYRCLKTCCFGFLVSSFWMIVFVRFFVSKFFLYDKPSYQ